MKKVFLFAFLALALTSMAGADVSDLKPANVRLRSHDDAYWLIGNGINIEEMHGNIAEVRLSQAQMDMVIAAGYAVTARTETVVAPKLLSGYHTYTQLTSFLDSIHTKYPSITKKVSFGTTVQGRNLWAFLVTSYPDSQMNKPEVRLAANIHGDEVVGKELLLDLIDSLTKSYGSNATITNYVNTREIWFVPSLNPDGNTLSQRYNANGEDLNRDYPVPDGGSNGGSVSGTETETQQTISYWGAKHPVLTMTFHGGAIVANYPWDYATTLCPDDGLARAVALGYSQLNLTMYNSTEFANGITNGGAWYIVRGSLQDWSYNTGGGLEITVECSNDKWPAASTLPSYWNDNKNSLLYYIRKCGEGIGGVVTDSATGLPLSGVTVTVSGTGKAITTDVPGDYHRMLTSGTYSLSFAKTGYATRTVSGVRVNFDSLTTLNVALKSTSSTTPTLAVSTTSWSAAAAEATSSAISVTNSGSTTVIAYTVTSDQTWLTVSAASGSTPGSFTMMAAANTGAARTATVTVTATTSGVSGSPKTIAVTQAAGSSQVTIFSDDMTGFPTGWTLSPAAGWTKSSTRFNSASYSARCDDASPYANSQANYMARSVSLSGYSSATLTFSIWQYTESGYDYVYLQYYTGSTWTTAWSRAGSYQSWSQQSATIPATATQVRFYFKSDASVTCEGAYIDDVVLTAAGAAAPSLALSTTSWSAAAAGATSSAVSVTNSGSTGAIAYTVTSNQTWLAVSAASGSTPGSFTMTAAANTGSARTAIVTVTATTAGVANSPQTIAVSQAAGGSSGTWTEVAATTQSAHPYANNFNNTWTITGPAGAAKMKVYFDSINVETRYDSVFVLNSAGTVVQSFTGARSKTWSAEVTGNVVKIKLKTDISVTGYGFLSGKYSYYTAAARVQEPLMGLSGVMAHDELLCQNAPNPVRSNTRICYNLPQAGTVGLAVYNLNGQLIRTLLDERQSAGFHSVEWDARDASGHQAANGIYIYRIIAGSLSATRKLIVVR